VTSGVLAVGGRIDPPSGSRGAGRALRSLAGAVRTIGSRPRLLACLLLLAGLGVRVEDPGPLETLRLQTFDLFQQLQPQAVAPPPAVSIVDIDEQSLAELGQWPWPRTQLARMTVNLVEAGAVVIGFDMLLAEPDRLSPALFAASTSDLAPDVRAVLSAQPSNDAVLADVLRGAPVVLGVSATHERTHPYAGRPGVVTPVASYNGDPRPFVLSFGSVIRNIDVLERAAPGRGMVTLNPERDGIVRRLPAVLRVGDDLYPSLTLEMLRVALGRPNLGVLSDPAGGGLRGVRIGPIDVPTDLHGLIWLDFAPHDPSRYVSAAAVVEGRFDPASVRGKPVLVGSSAVGLRDLRATPVHASMPGVEIHAQLLEALLREAFLERPNYALGVELAVTFLLGAALIVIVPRTRAVRSLILLGGLAGLIFGGAWYLFDAHALLFDPSYPASASGLVFLQLAYGNYARAESQRRQVRMAFSQFLAPALVERLVDNPDQLRLGGELREMTFLFSDVAGFTSFTEHTDPAVLVAVLNEYLDGVCQIIMDHGGTIDKIVGDAVHAIFNAPIDQPDHAVRAVTCALALDAFGRQFAAAKRREGMPFGQTRIGVNSGPAVVGNFGGSRRFDYTAHGDAINTAARLESVNKHLGTSICVAGATARQCPDLHSASWPAHPSGQVGGDRGVRAADRG
jgi:adenylate cyclase